MPKYTNVRYSLNAEDYSRMLRIQQHYQKKFSIDKISQQNVLRHMMRDVENMIEAAEDMKKLAAR